MRTESTPAELVDLGLRSESCFSFVPKAIWERYEKGEFTAIRVPQKYTWDQPFLDRAKQIESGELRIPRPMIMDSTVWVQARMCLGIHGASGLLSLSDGSVIQYYGSNVWFGRNRSEAPHQNQGFLMYAGERFSRDQLRLARTKITKALTSPRSGADIVRAAWAIGIEFRS